MSAPPLLVFSGPLLLYSERNLFALGVFWQCTTFLLKEKKKKHNINGGRWTTAYSCLSTLDASKTVMNCLDFVRTKLHWTWPKSESQVQQHSAYRFTSWTRPHLMSLCLNFIKVLLKICFIFPFNLPTCYCFFLPVVPSGFIRWNRAKSPPLHTGRPKSQLKPN